MSTYAIVDETNTVVNVVEWNGLTPWQPPHKTIAVANVLPSPAKVGSVYSYEMSDFVDP